MQPSRAGGRQHGVYAELSGKFLRLGELCNELAARQEARFDFYSFGKLRRSILQYLANIFGQPGLALHGNVAVKKRKELVDRFPQPDGPPFFVLAESERREPHLPRPTM